jgi:site-specific DNA-adenine methylase
MVKPINIILRTGNKQNDIKFFKHLLPLDVNTVVEPFGGSFSVIKHFYMDVNKYKFHINDLDETLHYVYNNFNDLILLNKQLNEEYNKHLLQTQGHNKDKHMKLYAQNLNINDKLKAYMMDKYFIRGNLYRCSQSTNYNTNEIIILQTATITNYNYKTIFDQYHDDDNAFLCLDPPYLFSDNSSYSPQRQDTDMTSILVYILDLLNKHVNVKLR